MDKPFQLLYTFFERQRKVFLWAVAAVFLVLAFFASKVHFVEDISSMLPRDAHMDKLNEVFQHSRFLEKIAVTISLNKDDAEPNPDSLIAYAEAFTEKLEAGYQPYVQRVQSKIDDNLMMEMFSYMGDYLPIFLEPSDYLQIDSLIQPQRLHQSLEDDYHTLTSPAGMVLKQMIARDPVGITYIALKKIQQFQFDENFDTYDGYIFTKDRRHLMMFVTPALPTNETAGNAVLIRGLDQIIDSLSTKAYPEVKAEYFGATAVAVGNANQLRQDTLLTLSITLILLVLFIWSFFRMKRAPILILVPVLFGALFSLTCIYFIKGSVSLIAMGAGSLILGIAINYSLHFFTHYKYLKDVREVIHELASPMTIGSFTTIGAFFCLQFVKSEILKDLGLFAAFSLIGAALCSLIILPHLVELFRSKVIARETEVLEPKLSWLEHLSLNSPERNKYLIWFIVLLTPVMLYFAYDVRFDSNMNNLNYMPQRLKASQDHLNKINAYALQSVFLVSDGHNLEEALQHSEQLIPGLDSLKKAGTIRKYASASTFLVSDTLQKERIAYWNHYWTPQKKLQLSENLKKEGAALHFSVSAFNPFLDLLNHTFEPAGREVWDPFRDLFLGEYITERNGKATVITLLKTDPANREKVYEHFRPMDHTIAVDRQYLARKFVEIVKDDFNLIATYSSLLVFFALLIAYGRIGLTLMTFIPMVVSWIWILGLMSIFGIEFNIINIILSTLIFGLGDDFSIFVMEGLQEEYRTGKKVLPVIKTSIVLSALTTIIGLGVLILAKHPAIRSLSLISIIGILCVVVISQTLEPFLFNVFIRNRTERGQAPVTFFAFFKSVFAFLWFVMGSIILSVSGLLLIRLNPFAGDRSKYVYHWLISKYTGSLIYVMANVRKRILNETGENFTKPAMIICNHQSFLDILSTTMLTPKVLLMTNKWVWESPVFGAVVRMADYYHVADGAEQGVDRLVEMVNKGYSILVFPEGTRSLDGKIRRFHKGAFFLAERLQLDILPILIHGTGYTMSKSDFLLKDGEITLKILPRISPEDIRFGENYTERTKGIARYFRDEFQKFSHTVETPAYWRNQLIHNYLFRGPILEWYMRIKTRMEGNYALFDRLLPEKGKILDLGCGYGFLDYMLMYRSANRSITGVDYDVNKIETAQHGYTRTDKLQFVAGDINQFPLERYDGIVLADVLHYLSPNAQQELLNKCLDALLPGGVFIVRDGNKDFEKRHQGTRLSEWFSTKMLGFNKTTTEGLSFISADLIYASAAGRKDVQVEVLDHTRLTSNIVFVIKKQNV